jgi:hypothetical protein
MLRDFIPSASVLGWEFLFCSRSRDNLGQLTIHCGLGCSKRFKPLRFVQAVKLDQVGSTFNSSNIADRNRSIVQQFEERSHRRNFHVSRIPETSE